ncbi:MAG TPA: hypothetical protein VGL29_14645 [Blastocatellia bacterium]|jgi:hypothetical protein
MKFKANAIVSAAAVVLLTIGPSLATTQSKNANRKPTVKGEMKETGKEVKNAGKGLGQNVKHGRVVRGAKHFGKHTGRAGKHLGKGSKAGVKKTGGAVKNATKP